MSETFSHHESHRKNQELSPVEGQVFDRLVNSYKKQAVSIDSFADLYKSTIIENDKKIVKERKAVMQETPDKKRAEILEAILGTQIELEDWFGPGAQTLPTSEYDDLQNGVDITVEFMEDNSFQHLALSIDATSNPKSVAEKLDKIKEKILAGKLTQVKYFVSERMDFRGQQNQVPNVVVGADYKTISELSNLWLNMENLRALPGNREKSGTPLSPEAEQANHQRFVEFRDKLAKHPIQEEILEQIKIQLEVFAEFASKNQKDVPARKYESALNIINGIIDIKKAQGIEPRRNEITEALKECLQRF